MRTGPAGVHDALGDALVVEVRNFFAQYEIFKQRGSPRAGLERILIIRNRRALVRRQAFAVSRYLVRFSTLTAAQNTLILRMFGGNSLCHERNPRSGHVG